MTEKQYLRWMRLSGGLAKSGFSGMRRARRKKLVEATQHCVDWIACNGIETINDWDSGPDYVGDRLTDWLYDNGHSHYHRLTDKEKGNKFGNQVACCVRAGFDLAVAPSAGVLAFNVGDLTRACRGRIPNWVREWFDPPLPQDISRTEELWL